MVLHFAAAFISLILQISLETSSSIVA